MAFSCNSQYFFLTELGGINADDMNSLLEQFEQGELFIL